ncbi:MAG: hypothetical protein WCE64_16875 [Bacteroidales bacterium]
MKRTEFVKKAGCGILCFSALPLINDSYAQGQTQTPKPKKFNIEIEIFEARKDTWCHKKGDKFKYPEQIGAICPWLLSSMHDFIRLLENDATLTWKYEGTAYEKIINKEGVTTEFVRCPDPTSNLVAKITRTEKS